MRLLFENLDVSDYYNIFVWTLVVFIFLGSLILRHIEFDTNKFLTTDRHLLITFVILIIFYTGTRAYNIGTDTYNYRVFYFNPGIRISNIFDFFERFETDFLFKVVMYISFVFKDFGVFLLTVSFIMNISIYTFVRKYTDYGRSGSSLLLFSLIACNMVFFSYQTNTIRNGLAIPFIFIAMYCLKTNKIKHSIFFLIIALLCHRTSMIPIACIFFALKAKNINIKYFIGAYLLAILAAAAGFGFNKLAFLSSFGNEDIQHLAFSGETNYKIGFRPDFVAYNTIFLFLCLMFSTLKNKHDLFLLKYYILASIIFFFNFNIPFSDRIGSYSWIVIPLLAYSIINNSYPRKKLYLITLATIFIFTLNYIILPFIKGDFKEKDNRRLTSHSTYQIENKICNNKNVILFSNPETFAINKNMIKKI